MPTKQTISTSIDSINHALEAATTITTSPYYIGLAKEAIRLVITYLPTAIAEPSNLTARYWLLYASAIAGMLGHGGQDRGLLHLLQGQGVVHGGLGLQFRR